MPPVTNSMQKLYKHPVWALIAAFGTYFCMYGFRKPYTAATYTGAIFWGIDYKVLLVITQTLGYVMAKWLGIKVVAEIKRNQRIKMLLVLILTAELTLLLFGIMPRPWNIVCLLLNGLSLGIVFGLVLGFLEGRQNTEALIAGLCVSFIVSDGVSKSVGKFLLDNGVTDNWMPFFAGLIFLVPSLLFMAMLNFVPPPSEKDVASRSAREPMPAKARWYFFKKYAPGLSGVILVYLFVTLLRSIRADFAPEIWQGLGYSQAPQVFTQSEVLVGFGVMVANGLAIFIASHYKALRTSLSTCLAGFILLLLAIVGLYNGLDKFAFMVLAGLGVYLPYVAVHTTIFERLIALTKERANVGFLMYLADSVGYTGYIILMLLKYVIPPGTSILSIFINISVCLAVISGLIVLFCNWYFSKKLKPHEQPTAGIVTG